MTEFFDKFPYRQPDLDLRETPWDGHVEGSTSVSFCTADELVLVLLKLRAIPDIEGDERRLEDYRRRVGQYILWVRRTRGG